MERHKPSLGAARQRTRDIEPRGKFGSAGHEECFNFRKLFFYLVNERAHFLDTRLRDRLRRTGGLGLDSKDMVLNIMEDILAATFPEREVVGARHLAPPDDSIQLIELSETFEDGGRLQDPSTGGCIKKFCRSFVAFAGKKYHITSIAFSCLPRSQGEALWYRGEECHSAIITRCSGICAG